MISDDSLESIVYSNGVGIWTTRKGSAGYPIVLCNGGAGCCDYLEPVAGLIDDIAQVIRFEQRGCGRSESVPPYDIETCLFDLETIRKHYGFNRWIVGGHSWGADLALIYALEHTTKVAGLICISGGRIHNDREWHSEYERRKRLEGERLPDFKYPPNLEVNRQLNQSWKQYIQKPDLLKEISHLKFPALFVYGDRDIRPSWPVEQVANLMPNARFEMIEGAEHVIWFSHESELRSFLRSFLAKFLWRDDMMAAKHILDHSLKQEHLRPMLEWHTEIDHQWSLKPGPYGRRLKQHLRPDLWVELECTYTGAGLEENWEALFRTIGLMRRVANEVGERLGFTYPEELEQRVLNYLRKVRQLDRNAEIFS